MKFRAHYYQTLSGDTYAASIDFEVEHETQAENTTLDDAVENFACSLSNWTLSYIETVIGQDHE